MLNTKQNKNPSLWFNHININIDPWTIIDRCTLVTWTCYELAMLNGLDIGLLNLDVHELTRI